MALVRVQPGASTCQFLWLGALVKLIHGTHLTAHDKNLTAGVFGDEGGISQHCPYGRVVDPKYTALCIIIVLRLPPVAKYREPDRVKIMQDGMSQEDMAAVRRSKEMVHENHN